MKFWHANLPGKGKIWSAQSSKFKEKLAVGFSLNVAYFLVCDLVRIGPNLVKEVPVELAILADFSILIA